MSNVILPASASTSTVAADFAQPVPGPGGPVDRESPNNPAAGKGRAGRPFGSNKKARTPFLPDTAETTSIGASLVRRSACVPKPDGLARVSGTFGEREQKHVAPVVLMVIPSSCVNSDLEAVGVDT